MPIGVRLPFSVTIRLAFQLANFRLTYVDLTESSWYLLSLSESSVGQGTLN
jgi:hypothetical protein